MKTKLKPLFIVIFLSSILTSVSCDNDDMKEVNYEATELQATDKGSIQRPSNG